MNCINTVCNLIDEIVIFSEILKDLETEARKKIEPKILEVNTILSEILTKETEKSKEKDCK